jgi:hypothetical protein
MERVGFVESIDTLAVTIRSGSHVRGVSHDVHLAFWIHDREMKLTFSHSSSVTEKIVSPHSFQLCNAETRSRRGSEVYVHQRASASA